MVFFVNVGPRRSSHIPESNVTFKKYLNESLNEILFLQILHRK